MEPIGKEFPRVHYRPCPRQGKRQQKQRAPFRQVQENRKGPSIDHRVMLGPLELPRAVRVAHSILSPPTNQSRLNRQLRR